MRHFLSDNEFCKKIMNPLSNPAIFIPLRHVQGGELNKDMTDKKTNLYMPAEWQHQWAVQLTWPHEDTDWRDYLEDITQTFITLAEVITRHERLIIVTPHRGTVSRQLNSRLTSEAMSRVIWCDCPTDDTWARDHGAITLLGHNGDIASSLLLDFCFNGWGMKFPSSNDNAINRTMAAKGIFPAPLEDHNDFVLEGGSIESDGLGTIFTTSTCLLAPHRNQPLTREEIEERLKIYLRAKRIVWLDHGTLIGDDTDGHIDTIVRCAPDDTLVYVGCDDTNDEQYNDFLALERQLQGLRTTDGRPYRLLRLPMPTAIYEDGERLPATYANFLVINGAVIVPSYGQPERDAIAAAVIAQAFPGREVISIDACTVVRQHGSLHCLTMQYPSFPDE